MKNYIPQILVFSAVIALASILPFTESQGEGLVSSTGDDPPSTEERLVSVNNTAVVAPIPHHYEKPQPVQAVKQPTPKVRDHMSVIVTAYSSEPNQTWGDPFITATGNRVRDGIVATNLLPFGTEIRIPSLYGDRVFVVDDRMARRKNQHVDIWFANTQDAINFGKRNANIEIIER